jgi:hypothetical protein
VDTIHHASVINKGKSTGSGAEISDISVPNIGKKEYKNNREGVPLHKTINGFKTLANSSSVQEKTNEIHVEMENQS